MQARRQRQYLLSGVEDAIKIQVEFHHGCVRSGNKTADRSQQDDDPGREIQYETELDLRDGGRSPTHFHHGSENEFVRGWRENIAQITDDLRGVGYRVLRKQDVVDMMAQHGVAQWIGFDSPIQS